MLTLTLQLVIGRVEIAHVNLKKTYFVIQKVDKEKFSFTGKPGKGTIY